MAVIALDSLAPIGGAQVLLEDVFQQLESQLQPTRLTIGRDPLVASRHCLEMIIVSFSHKQRDEENSNSAPEARGEVAQGVSPGKG